MSGKLRWLRRTLGVLVTLGAMAVFAFVLHGLQSVEQTAGAEQAAAPSVDERAVAVTAAPIVVQPVQRSVGAVGSFFGFEEVTVAAEVLGRVVKVYHDVGDSVRPGEVLLEIDPTDYQLAHEETLRALQAEVARVISPLPPDEDFEPERAQAILRGLDRERLPSVVRAREQERNASLRLARAKELMERKSISSEEYDQRSTDHQIAIASLTQARLDAQAIVAAIRHRLVLLQMAKHKLDLTQLRVPVPTPGDRLPRDVQYVVVERKVSEGEMVKDALKSSMAAFELVVDTVLKLRANVPERFASQVQTGQKAEVRVDAYPNKVFPGKVMRINPLIDRTSRTFEVEVHVDNPQRELKAGGFAKVDILTHVDPQAWTVPVEAIVTYAGSTKVFVIRDGRADAIPVTTGLEGRGWVELLRPADSDLRQNDQVITSGQDKLAEGVAVQKRMKDER